MYVKAFTNVVAAINVPVVSQAVPMNGDNACYVSVVSMVSGVGTAQLQQSNDLTNWTNVGSAVTPAPAAAPSVTSSAVTGISGAYIRLVLTATAGTSMYSADLNTVNTCVLG